MPPYRRALEAVREEAAVDLLRGTSGRQSHAQAARHTALYSGLEAYRGLFLGGRRALRGLIDSLILGCIPVLFAHQELDMFEAFASAEEWAKATVFVPEAMIMGPGPTSHWTKGGFHVPRPLKTARRCYRACVSEAHSRWRELQKLYPEHTVLFEALSPKHSQEDGLKESAPKAALGA